MKIVVVAVALRSGAVRVERRAHAFVVARAERTRRTFLLFICG